MKYVLIILMLRGSYDGGSGAAAATFEDAQACEVAAQWARRSHDLRAQCFPVWSVSRVTK